MDTLEEKLSGIIEPICKNSNIYLHGIEIKGSHSHVLIKVTVDTDEGITLNRCQFLSRQISDVLEQKDLIKNDYRLEVSSPGIDKPLQYPYEYRRNIGRDLVVVYYQQHTVKQFIGKLLAYHEKELIFEVGKDRVSLAKDQIKSIKIKLKW